ncbi:MAG: HigA family addiction module antitoxin [Syntrophales bacterium]
MARDIDVPPGRITEIIRGKRTITADTALRLGKYFGVSPEIWLNLQVDYDMRVPGAPSGLRWNPVSVSGRHKPEEARRNEYSSAERLTLQVCHH